MLTAAPRTRWARDSIYPPQRCVCGRVVLGSCMLAAAAGDFSNLGSPLETTAVRAAYRTQ